MGFIARETDCLPSFIRKGIAMSCFYYARCLHEGAGAKKDEGEAKRFYSRVSNGSFCEKMTFLPVVILLYKNSMFLAIMDDKI